MLEFHYTCPGHRQRFIEAVKRAGCCDPRKMEEVQQRLLRWTAARYPRLMLDHYQEKTCLGCEIERRFGSLGEVGQALRELVKEANAG